MVRRALKRLKREAIKIGLLPCPVCLNTRRVIEDSWRRCPHCRDGSKIANLYKTEEN